MEEIVGISDEKHTIIILNIILQQTRTYVVLARASCWVPEDLFGFRSKISIPFSCFVPSWKWGWIGQSDTSNISEKANQRNQLEVFLLLLAREGSKSQMAAAPWLNFVSLWNVQLRRFSPKMKFKCLILVAFCLALKCVSAIRYDCCLSELSSFGQTCSYSGTSYGNETYYCVSVTEICPNCMLSSDVDIESANCYQCCSTDANSCGISISFISTSTWCKCYSFITVAISRTNNSLTQSFFKCCSSHLHHIRWLVLLLLHRLSICWAQQTEGGAYFPRGLSNPHTSRVSWNRQWG